MRCALADGSRIPHSPSGLSNCESAPPLPLAQPQLHLDYNGLTAFELRKERKAQKSLYNVVKLQGNLVGKGVVAKISN
jgi:hypothetical protein